MRRALFAGFVACFIQSPFLAAGEPAASSASERKAAIEKLLDAPLNWDLRDRDQATLAELIEHLRDEHRLTIRWDVGALALIFGEQSPLGEMLPFARRSPGSASYVSESPAYTGTPQPLVVPDASQPVSPYYPAGPAEGALGPAPAPSGKPAIPQLAPAPAPVPAASDVVAPSGAPAANPPGEDAVAASQPENGESGENAASGPQAVIAQYLASPVALSMLALERATVRDALQQMLGAVSVNSAAMPLAIGLPVTTKALNLDLLVDESSVLITTRLRANSAKETRVYRLGSLRDVPSETLVRVITHSVRPWSWRSQANDIAEQLATRWPKTPIPLPKIEVNVTEGVKFAGAEAGAADALSALATPNASEETVAATGQLLAGGAVAAVHTVVAAMEIVHHGDPPTAVIEPLPGMLVITQSQAAHREIKELLDLLSQGE